MESNKYHIGTKHSLRNRFSSLKHVYLTWGKVINKKLKVDSILNVLNKIKILAINVNDVS